MIELRVNGKKRAFQGPEFTRLIDVLRVDFGLTGTKVRLRGRASAARAPCFSTASS